MRGKKMFWKKAAPVAGLAFLCAREAGGENQVGCGWEATN
jgi:hypothetical protein